MDEMITIDIRDYYASDFGPDYYLHAFLIDIASFSVAAEYIFGRGVVL